MITTNQSNPSPFETLLMRSFVKLHLDTVEILNEVLFGLIMVLTFTLGAGLIVKEGHEATTQLLLGVLGCNVVWGIIDGAMYMINCMFERSRKARLFQFIQKAAREEDALSIVGHEFDDALEPFTTPSERKQLYQAVLKRLNNVTPERTRLKKEDIYGAIACFWLVFFSTIPAVVPFLIFHDRFVALRVSNLLLLIMLFLVGYRLARDVHSNPWIFGSTLLLTGLVLVAIAIALGG